METLFVAILIITTLALIALGGFCLGLTAMCFTAFSAQYLPYDPAPKWKVKDQRRAALILATAWLIFGATAYGVYGQLIPWLAGLAY